VGGQPMNAQDSASNVYSFDPDSEVLVYIMNVANCCTMLTASQQPSNAKVIAIQIATRSASGVSAPTALGNYPIYTAAGVGAASGNVSLARYQTSDATCAAMSDYEATSGSVTLTRIDASSYAGDFDITFSDSGTGSVVGHLTGSFNANLCAALGPTIGGTCI
jgi:ethanolamine utilization microcompartment shell protein EutS